MRASVVALLILLTLGWRPWGQEPSGNRAYRKGDYARAIERYRETRARRGVDPRLSYNLGNALIDGPGAANADALRGAIDAYRRSLLLDPRRDDARWNLELASRRLEQLESNQSPSGQEADSSGMPAGDPGEEREGLRGEPSTAGGTGSGAGSLDERAERGAADSALPKELAEQILRAVEERERGLQREKMRRERRRTQGPDW